MTTNNSVLKTENADSAVNDNKKGIENHKKVAKHLEEAAKHHLDAAKHHENGNHEKAALSSVKAHGEQCLANDAHKEDLKHHARYI